MQSYEWLEEDLFFSIMLTFYDTMCFGSSS